MNDKTAQHLFRSDFIRLWDPPPDLLPPLWCDMAGITTGKGQIHDPHPVSTLELILEGSAGLEYRGHSYTLRKGDFFFLAVGERHRLYPLNGPAFRKLFLTVTGIGTAPVCDALFGANHIFRPDAETMERTYGLIAQLAAEMNLRGSVSRAAGAIYQILLEVSSCCPKKVPSELGEILRYLDEHISEPLTLPQMSKALHLPSLRLQTLFRKHFQLSPTHYFRQLKMKKAALLLRDTTLSIKEIGQMTGYHSGLTFAREFRKNYGTKPSEFRKR